MMGRRGFTLVELLIVLLICAALFGVTFPALNRLGVTLKNETAIRLAAGSLRLTQSRALCRNETCTFEGFGFAKNGYALPGGSGTKISPNGKKLVLSSYGRVRIE